MNIISLALVLVTACRTAPQEKQYTLDASARETPAKEKSPPGFVCEGTTDLPDGTRIDVEFFMGKAITGAHLFNDAKEVKGGKFSLTFSLFPSSPKNLAGTYVARVRFNPLLQQARFSALPAIERDLVLKIGSEEDAAKDRHACGEKLVGKMKELLAVSDEAEACRKEGKLDAAGWGAKMKDWEDRADKINREVGTTPEYVALGWGPFVGDGFEKITGTVLDLCRFAQRGDGNKTREGRERLVVIISSYEDGLLGRPLDPKKTRLELGKVAREVLKEAVYGPAGNPVPRRKFRQAMLDINRLVSAEARQTVLEISASVNELFELVDSKKDAAELYGKIDARLADLVAALQNEK